MGDFITMRRESKFGRYTRGSVLSVRRSDTRKVIREERKRKRKKKRKKQFSVLNKVLHTFESLKGKGAVHYDVFRSGRNARSIHERRGIRCGMLTPPLCGASVSC